MKGFNISFLSEDNTNLIYLVVDVILNYVHTNNLESLKLKNHNVEEILLAADYLR